MIRATGQGRISSRAAMAVGVAFCLAASWAGQLAWGQEALSVPATFVRYVRVPGNGDRVLRPSALHYDADQDEILVADPGHDRVVIFSGSGAFKFAFSLGDSMTSPLDLVTGPEGMIYVLGSSPGGRILQRFDFDGQPLARLPIPASIAGQGVGLTHLACDDHGQLFGLDADGLRILRLGSSNVAVLCSLQAQLDSESAGAYGLGTLVWDRGEFLLPVATAGYVLRYGTDGNFLGTIGHGGSKPGTLAFPVAAVRSPEGIFLVLDKNRFCVLCYGPQGAFLGEFGGKGLSPGWFVNPSLLAVSRTGTVVVGQIFANRIQIVGLPRFIRDKVSRAATAPSDSFNSRRFTLATPCLFTCGADSGHHNLNSVSLSEAPS